MKKKIGDLTINEINKICEDIFRNPLKSCDDCPFDNNGFGCFDVQEFQSHIDQEIEVEENEKENKKYYL